MPGSRRVERPARAPLSAIEPLQSLAADPSAPPPSVPWTSCTSPRHDRRRIAALLGGYAALGLEQTADDDEVIAASPSASRYRLHRVPRRVLRAVQLGHYFRTSPPLPRRPRLLPLARLLHADIGEPRPALASSRLFRLRASPAGHAPAAPLCQTRSRRKRHSSTPARTPRACGPRARARLLSGCFQESRRRMQPACGERTCGCTSPFARGARRSGNPKGSLLFRTVQGFWACSNPGCDQVPPDCASPERKFGRIYSRPQLLCECGGRVLDLLYCQTCGEAYLGGHRAPSEEPGQDFLVPDIPLLEGLPDRIDDSKVTSYALFWPSPDRIPADREWTRAGTTYGFAKARFEPLSGRLERRAHGHTGWTFATTGN